MARVRPSTMRDRVLQGTISAGGSLELARDGAHQAGHVRARAGELEASARVRAFGPLPYRETFDDITGRGRRYWLGAGRYQVTELAQRLLFDELRAQGVVLEGIVLKPSMVISGSTAKNRAGIEEVASETLRPATRALARRIARALGSPAPDPMRNRFAVLLLFQALGDRARREESGEDTRRDRRRFIQSLTRALHGLYLGPGD